MTSAPGLIEPEQLSTSQSAERASRRPPPLVPASSIAGRALVVIIAIMTYLGCLTIGAVDLVRSAASDWTSTIIREVTIQVRPVTGRSLDVDTRIAQDLALRVPGVADVSAYSAAESARLLEPWLGSGLGLGDLPVPRLIVVRLTETGRADLPALRTALSDALPSASLDDHRQWFDRLNAMARTVIIAGLTIIGLMILTTALSVVFATRAAVATNRPVVEVLHFVGARDQFIAGQFMRHVLGLGLKGGLIGGAGALASVMAAGVAAGQWRATAGGDQLEALFGTFALGWTGYAGFAAVIILVAGAAAGTSWWTVLKTLRAID